MNPYRPNHMGIEIGTVIKATAKKITIKLSDTLRQGDGLRFLNEKEDQGCNVNKIYLNNLLVAQAKSGDIIELDYHGFVDKGAKVLKTSDKEQLENMLATYEKPQLKIFIQMEVCFHKGEAMLLHIVDEDGFCIEKTSTMLVEQARTTPLDEERLVSQLKKCKDTIFHVGHVFCEMDEDATLPIKEINQLRRSALEELLYLRQHRTYNKRYGTYHREFQQTQTQDTYAILRTKEQYDCLRQYPNIKLYVGKETLYQELYTSNPKIGYYGERVMKHEYPGNNVMFCENGGISTHGIADRFVNITNAYAAAFLFSHGVEAIVFSSECSNEQCEHIIEACEKRYGCSGNFIQMCYGYEEYMISEYCPINMCIKDNNKQHCGLCKGATKYYLEDVKGKQYPLYGDEQCRMHILSDVPHYRETKNVSKLFVFFNETSDEVLKVLHE